MRIVLLAAASTAYGQSPVFEVASIQPYVRPEGQTFLWMGCTGGPGSRGPGRWSCEAMRPYQVAGLDSMGAGRHNITAKA